MAKYIFMVEYKYANEELIYKEGKTEERNYIGSVFYWGKGDIFVTNYARVCHGVNDLKHTLKSIIML